MVCTSCNKEVSDKCNFCNICGTRIVKDEGLKKLPKMLDIDGAVKEFFKGKVSKDFLYRLVRCKEIPHVKVSTGKILFDEDLLVEWWTEQLKKSVQIQEKGLKRII